MKSGDHTPARINPRPLRVHNLLVVGAAALVLLLPGATVAVTLQIPEGMEVPSLYKVRNGVLVPLEELGIALSEEMAATRTITYTLVDGGPGDDDGGVDGIIVDPLVITADGPAPGGTSGSGGGCALAPASDSLDDFVLLMIPLLVLIGVKWFREGIDVRRHGRDQGL